MNLEFSDLEKKFQNKLNLALNPDLRSDLDLWISEKINAVKVWDKARWEKDYISKMAKARYGTDPKDENKLQLPWKPKAIKKSSVQALFE